MAGPTAMSIAAPTPCVTRAPMSARRLGALAHIADPATKNTKPVRYTCLRPRTSAALPARASRLLIARRYAVRTQLTSASFAARSRAIDGADTATRLVLSAATKAPADATDRTRPVARGFGVVPK